MSSTATVRVDLPSAGRVDRTVPARLRNYISSPSWSSFCEQLDEAMERARRARCFVPIIFGGLFLVTALIFSLSFTAASSTGMNSGPPIGPFVIVPILWVVTMIVVFVCSMNFNRKVREKLQSICEMETRTYYPRLSFHVKENQVYDYYYQRDASGTRTLLYIEVQINTRATATTTTADVEAPIMATAFPYKEPEIPVATTAPVELSVADRMDRLEQIKHHLSPDVYEHKKQEILDSI